MIIGTTPTHTFTLPYDTNLIKDLVITYSQYDTMVFQKSLSDCTLSGNKIAVNLSKEDTTKLKDDIYNIQIEVTTQEDKVIKSKYVYDIAFLG